MALGEKGRFSLAIIGSTGECDSHGLADDMVVCGVFNLLILLKTVAVVLSRFH